MGLLNKLMGKSKESTAIEEVAWPVIVAAGAEGTVIPMEQIPDDIFSAGVLGTCCGIDPVKGEVYAPINGKITQVADTLHAVGIEGTGGVEILIHVGVDTVDMKGDGFQGMVKTGDSVTKGQLLMTMDLDKIKKAGHPAVVITIVTNPGEFAKVEMIASEKVGKGADLLSVEK